jgi:hypothetical protein
MSTMPADERNLVPMRLATRPARIALLAGAAAVLSVAAGCDGSAGPYGQAPTATAGPSSGAAPTSAPATTPPAAGGTTPTGSAGSGTPGGDRCHTSDLGLAFGPGDAGAGQRFGTVILRNRSGRRCAVQGFGGLQLLDAAKRPLPTTLSRVGAAPRVVLGPGSDQISKEIAWAAIPTGADPDPAKQCPLPAYVAVTPPDETTSLVGRWPYSAVCDGRISGRAYGAR